MLSMLWPSRAAKKLRLVPLPLFSFSDEGLQTLCTATFRAIYLLRVCLVDTIKTSLVSHGFFSPTCIAATPYLIPSHTAQYRENLDLHHQQRLNNTWFTVSACSTTQPPSPIPADAQSTPSRTTPEARPRPLFSPTIAPTTPPKFHSNRTLTTRPSPRAWSSPTARRVL
ncbi:hypothetical protein F5Y19DRAFT_478915 [Xylariaceae sp. FL1651]|nr:hypothetical protein F5Y19DRAFT_478915 [Xylariaceae sp. FL1651]